MTSFEHGCPTVIESQVQKLYASGEWDRIAAADRARREAAAQDLTQLPVLNDVQIPNL